MTRTYRGISLPRLNSSVSPAPAVLTLQSAQVPSPGMSPTSANATLSPQLSRQRADSKRLTRISELLSSIRNPQSPSTSSSAMLEEERDFLPELERLDERAEMVGAIAKSQIEFFIPHPWDRENKLTFLDASSGKSGESAAVADHPAATEKDEAPGLSASLKDAPRSPTPSPLPASTKSRPTTAATQKSTAMSSNTHEVSLSPPRLIPSPKITARSPSWASIASSSELPAPAHDPLAGFERLDLSPQARKHPYARIHAREYPLLDSRPATPYELPGRFRNSQTCWQCTYALEGCNKRCQFCGKVVGTRGRANIEST